MASKRRSQSHSETPCASSTGNKRRRLTTAKSHLSTNTSKGESDLASSPESDGNGLAEDVYSHGGDIVVNFGRLHAYLRKENLHDEIKISISPNPAGDGSKIVRLQSQVHLLEDSESPVPSTESGRRQSANTQIADRDTADSAVTADSSLDPNAAVPDIEESRETSSSVQITHPDAEQTTAGSRLRTADPLGLPRIGNTCYRNVCLLAIAYSQHMQTYLDRLIGRAEDDQPSEHHVKTLHRKKKIATACIACHLRSIAGTIWREHGKRPSDKGLNGFHNTISDRYNKLLTGKDRLDDPHDWRNSNANQTDAATALDWFLEQLTNDRKALRPSAPDSDPFASTIVQHVVCDNCGDVDKLETRHQRVLLLKNSRGYDSLEDALKDHIVPQFATSSARNPCPECNDGDSRHLCGAFSGPLPEVLFIQLQPSHLKGAYHKGGPNYSQELDLTQYAEVQDQKSIYVLIAVIGYTGIFSQNAHWLIHASAAGMVHRIDDNWVQKVDPAALLQPRMQTDKDGVRTTPFMLVYEKRDTSDTARTGALSSESPLEAASD